MSAETVVQELTPSVVIFTRFEHPYQEMQLNVMTYRPFKRMGVLPIGGRSTAIKLASGDVWVLASTTLDEVTKARIDELGTVKYIMAADTEHNIYLGEFKKAYPNAKLIGTERLAKKQTDLEFAGAYGRDPADTKYGFEPEIEACYFPETVNNEIAFFHAESRSVIEGDLIWNIVGKSMLSISMTPETTLHKKFSWLTSSDKDATREHVKQVLSWDFERIIPCHGDVIDGTGKEAWKSAYEAYFS